MPYIPNGVVVTATRGTQAEAVADHAFALLLALSRGIAQFRDCQRAHLWDRTVRVDELCGKTMVVIGLGEVVDRLPEVLPRGAVLINVARGEVVDENACIHSPHYTERAIEKFEENLGRFLHGEPLDRKEGY